MPIRILIADDHAVFRSGLRALLERESDLEVVAEAADGIATVKAAADQQIDVLLLDISMPGLSGPQVAETVLRKQPDLAIVVLTMHEDEKYMQELFKIGVCAYVLKKSTGDDLVAAIRSVCRGDKYVDPTMAIHILSPHVRRKSAAKKSEVDLLTPREREICALLAYGHTNAEIGKNLFISERTVETHRANIMAKLDLGSRAELVRFAIDNALLKLS